MSKSWKIKYYVVNVEQGSTVDHYVAHMYIISFFNVTNIEFKYYFVLLYHMM